LRGVRLGSIGQEIQFHVHERGAGAGAAQRLRSGADLPQPLFARGTLGDFLSKPALHVEISGLNGRSRVRLAEGQ
jgi:hypothetical protein